MRSTFLHKYGFALLTAALLLFGVWSVWVGRAENAVVAQPAATALALATDIEPEAYPAPDVSLPVNPPGSNPVEPLPSPALIVEPLGSTSIPVAAPSEAYPAPPAFVPTVSLPIEAQPARPAALTTTGTTKPRIGLQVGHWKSNELPDELSRLRTSTGAFAAGVREADLNLAIAQRTAELLRGIGVDVDLLPATVPPQYEADAFIAIHADGVTRPGPRGYKLATPWRTSRDSQLLADSLLEEYGIATGLPRSTSITVNMKGYYAFMYRLYSHTIAKTTPAVILELGYLTSPEDRQLLLGDQERVAVGVANGIVRYLNSRNPQDLAAREPVEYPIVRARTATDVRASRDDNARSLLRVDRTYRLVPINERDGWYEVVVARDWRIVGWVRIDQTEPTGEPLPNPPPTDS
jgi:N-acetylmuramoyl-L-alanine amidase